MATMSANRHAAIVFDGAPSVTIGPADADEPRGFEALHLLARDAYLVGLLGRMLEMATAYATNRVQFGRPIGSFQAIQHRCADMALAVYGARILTYQAAWLAAQGRKGSQAAMAHAYVRDAAGEVVAHAHQIHGAIGITKEYPLQYFSRRAKAFQNALGTAAHFREKVATGLWGAP
jgi:alkylation response protein AidB-like acyl-CoA dehydrogenase